jgi:hypothetical protein
VSFSVIVRVSVSNFAGHACSLGFFTFVASRLLVLSDHRQLTALLATNCNAVPPRRLVCVCGLLIDTKNTML